MQVISRGSSKPTLMGNGLISVEWPPRVTENRSQSIFDSRNRSTVSRKLLQWNWMWNPMMSEPSIPWRISWCHGQMPYASGFGHGMCQKMATFASGRFSLINDGSRARW